MVRPALVGPSGEGRPDREVSIHLLHGTWARGFFSATPDPARPRWFDSKSPFSQALAAKLRARGVHARFPAPFLWSGSNSLTGRYRAVASFRQHFEQDDCALRVVIAHSHGGNIALRAIATMVRENRPAGIATLSTPFIVTREKEPSASELVMAFSVFFALVLGPLYLFGSPYMSGGHVPTPTPEQAAHFRCAFLYTISSVGLFILASAKRMGIVGRAIEISPHVSPGVPLIVLRSPGDEASLVLAWGDLLEKLNTLFRTILDALTTTITVRLIHLLKRLEPRLGPILMVASFAVSASCAVLIWLHSRGDEDPGHTYLALSPVLLLLSPMLLIAGGFAVAMIAGLGCLLVTCFASLGYGLEYAAIGWSARTTCETTPLGATVLVRSIESDGESFLAHSVYNSDEAIELLATWISTVATPPPA